MIFTQKKLSTLKLYISLTGAKVSFSLYEERFNYEMTIEAREMHFRHKNNTFHREDLF